MTSPLFHLQSDSGELFGEFPSHKSAHAFIERNGLEWEPLFIVSAESVRSQHRFWMPSPLPLSALTRSSLQLK